MNRRLRPFAWLLALAPLPSCAGGDAHEAVWSEAFDYAAVESQDLPPAASHGLEVYQAMQPGDFRSPALTSLVEAAKTRGVTLRAWILLPSAQGYWPGETNVDAFSQAVDDFLAWVKGAQLPVGWICFDMEPDLAYTQQINAIMGNAGDPQRLDKLIALMKSHVDPAAFAAAKAKYQALVGRVHDAGLQAHVVTYPIVLDGLATGTTTLEDAFDIPVTGVDWDEASFMVYRSTYQAFSSVPLSTDLIYSYAVDAKAAYGEKAGIDLGVIGSDPLVNAQGYADPAALSADVAAARAAGIDKLHVFSLQEAVATPTPDAWLSFAAAPASDPPPDDGAVHALRSLFVMLSGVLGG